MIALASAPFGVFEKSQFFRPITNGLMLLSARLFDAYGRQIRLHLSIKHRSSLAQNVGLREGASVFLELQRKRQIMPYVRMV